MHTQTTHSSGQNVKSMNFTDEIDHARRRPRHCTLILIQMSALTVTIKIQYTN